MLFSKITRSFKIRTMNLVCFFSLILGYLSLWLKKSPWLWGGFTCISFISAVQLHELQPLALIGFGTLAVVFLVLQFPLEGLLRFLLVSLAFLISCGIFFQIIPDFTLHLPKGLNYGKSLIGLSILGLFVPTLETKQNWLDALKKPIPLAFLGTSILCFLAYNLPYPKAPSSLHSLLLFLLGTVLPEEALLRGFIQKELFGFIGKGILGHVGVVFISMVLFSFFHLIWAEDISFLPLILAEGLVYATLYEATDVLESSILCRFFTTFILSSI
jgi:membrane protease YdiL (CAAX protease family)